jgi:hypothetical protein
MVDEKYHLRTLPTNYIVIRDIEHHSQIANTYHLPRHAASLKPPNKLKKQIKAVSNFGYNSQSVSGRNTMVAKLVIWTY